MIKYDYKEFTDKDMFEVKLKNTVPNFGYISCPNRSKFFSFCTSMGFIEFAGTASNKKKYAYRVLVSFVYSARGNYRNVDVDCDQGQLIIVDTLFRPREKLNGIFGSNISGIRPPNLPSEYDNA
jgi:hypothetical protein